MKMIVTYCSGPKRKDGGLIPAVDRYLSDRIRTLHQQARGGGDESRIEFRILSGEFGLLHPDQSIPWYDHLLQPEEVRDLAARVALSLSESGVQGVEYHTADPALHAELIPYRETITAACELAGIRMEIITLAGNPD